MFIGIILGLYVGLYQCLYLGINNIIDFFKSPEAYSNGFIIWNFIRAIFFETFGGLVMGVFWLIGLIVSDEI